MALLATSLALPRTARAADFEPTAGALGGPGEVIGFVETLQPGQAISPSSGFSVRGWVVDRTAQGWAGVVAVEVYDGLVEEGGRLLGSSTAYLSRPDVARALGNSYWERSGFDVFVSGGQFSWGDRTIAVYAVTENRGRYLKAIPISIRAASPSPSDPFPEDPIIRVLDPLPMSIVRASPAVIRGYALDRNVTAGFGVTGVDRVEIYLGPREAGGTFIGTANLGKRYGEPGLEFNDQRFDTAGFDAIWEPRQFGRGDFELYFYARRSGTDVWNVQRVRVTLAL